METLDPGEGGGGGGGRASLDPRGMVDRTYKCRGPLDIATY